MTAPSTDDRSILFITVDCLRADHVGCYGYDRPTTPSIDKLADDATVFEHSYANCPQTRWAMQSLHTGVCAHAIDGLGIPDEPGVALAEQLKAAGYATAGFANNGFVSREYNYHRGFGEYRSVSDFSKEKSFFKRLGDRVDPLVKSKFLRANVYTPLVEMIRSAEGTMKDNVYREPVTDRDVVGAALNWIDGQQETDTPFFAWIHLMDAHTPYSRWDEHLEALRGDTDVEHVVRPHNQITVGEEPSEAVIDAYDAGVRSADEQIGCLLEAVSDDTAVVLTGDHGESFGRYAGFHSGKVYSSFTQVPIVVRAPEVQQGRIDDYPVQHLDLPPTLLEIAGADVPASMTGDPLQRIDRELDHPIHFCITDDNGADQVGIRTGKWKYIAPKVGDRGLCRVPHMGVEETKIGDEHPETRKRLVTMLAEHERQMTERTIGSGTDTLTEGTDDLSNTVEENLERLGYIE